MDPNALQGQTGPTTRVYPGDPNYHDEEAKYFNQNVNNAGDSDR